MESKCWPTTQSTKKSFQTKSSTHRLNLDSILGGKKVGPSSLGGQMLAQLDRWLVPVLSFIIFFLPLKKSQRYLFGIDATARSWPDMMNRRTTRTRCRRDKKDGQVTKPDAAVNGKRSGLLFLLFFLRYKNKYYKESCRRMKATSVPLRRQRAGHRSSFSSKRG